MTEGKKFSQVYLEQSVPANDSRRMRNRISSVHWELLRSESSELINRIQQETGAKVPFVGGSYSLAKFFEECEIRDLLDSITIIFQYYHSGRVNKHKAPQWHQFVSRVFREENLGYRLDDLGGVHFYHDEEFERNRVATIAGLSEQSAVRETFTKAYAFLDQDKPDTASAIRAVFESIEILYKHIINAEGKDRLNSLGVQKFLKPIFQQTLGEKKVELKATEHMLDGLCDWIDAGHMYRHGQKNEELEEPSIEYAVLFISQGASYLRFLLQHA